MTVEEVLTSETPFPIYAGGKKEPFEVATFKVTCSKDDDGDLYDYIEDAWAIKVYHISRVFYLENRMNVKTGVEYSVSMQKKYSKLIDTYVTYIDMFSNEPTFVFNVVDVDHAPERDHAIATVHISIDMAGKTPEQQSVLGLTL